MKSIAQIIIFIFPALLSATSHATERECGDDDRIKGYWFYCATPLPEEEEKDKRQELPPPPPHQELMTMHPDDLAKLQDAYLKEAVWKPQPQKVLAYYTIHDAIRRKSMAFMSVSSVVMLENPELNSYGQFHKTNPGRATRTRLRQEQTDRNLEQYRRDYAIVIFTEKTCPFCVTQKNILMHFMNRHGWEMREVDIREHPEAVEKFGVTMTPVTIVVSRDNQKWMPIAVGAEALPTLEDNAYRAIRYLQGETSPEQFLNMEYEMGGITDPSANLRETP